MVAGCWLGRAGNNEDAVRFHFNLHGSAELLLKLTWINGGGGIFHSVCLGLKTSNHHCTARSTLRSWGAL